VSFPALSWHDADEGRTKPGSICLETSTSRVSVWPSGFGFHLEPHVIDKGIPTAGLLAHTLVSKYGDHLPLYRQERIFARAGLAIPGAWVGDAACGCSR